MQPHQMKPLRWHSSLYVDGKEYALPSRSSTPVKITRSFSYKLNVGNYESRDFFCSHSSECDSSQADEVAADSRQFCIDKVLESVGEYRAALNDQRGRKAS
jgi:hypothetical protein